MIFLDHCQLDCGHRRSIFFVLLHPSVGYISDPWIFDLLDPDRAIYGVALTGVWQNLGLTFIITLAGLQAVPDELLEAAPLDGFGPVRQFFRVTLPLISPTLLFLSVVLTVFGLQAFAQIDVLTDGGPAGSTEMLVFKIFNATSSVGASARVRSCPSGSSS